MIRGFASASRVAPSDHKMGLFSKLTGLKSIKLPDLWSQRTEISAVAQRLSSRDPEFTSADRDRLLPGLRQVRR